MMANLSIINIKHFCIIVKCLCVQIYVKKLSVNTFTINESDEAELLGLTIDKQLNFSKHIDKLCHNAQYKLHALRRIRKYLSLEKAKMLGNAFIDSHFNYAPLIWMFSRKGLYLKMQK